MKIAFSPPPTPPPPVHSNSNSNMADRINDREPITLAGTDKTPALQAFKWSEYFSGSATQGEELPNQLLTLGWLTGIYSMRNYKVFFHYMEARILIFDRSIRPCTRETLPAVFKPLIVPIQIIYYFNGYDNFNKEQNPCQRTTLHKKHKLW